MMQGERHITLEEAGMTPVMDDKHDPLGYAKRFGITPEDLAVLDKEVRFTRFNPTDNTKEKITFIHKRLRNENHLGARGIAHVLYKNGARAIWVLDTGRFFFGTQQAYFERMKVTSIDQAFSLIKDV